MNREDAGQSTPYAANHREYLLVKDKNCNEQYY